MADFLVEIGTEELPPKSLQHLAMHFSQTMQTLLIKAEFSFSTAHSFATPRRLAVLVNNLSSKQPDLRIERKGPALAAAFNPPGQPTPACVGFARSCGVAPSELITIQNSQGEWVGYCQTVTGKTIQEMIPSLVMQALVALPIPKRMRWGNSTVEFIRPVHSVILLYGKEVIPAAILGVQADRKTQGHRFHTPGWISIANPARYLKILAKKFVLADFVERQDNIKQQITATVEEVIGTHAHALVTENLLNEVTGLVEWPVALCGKFDKDFLAVPPEALISAMQDHQRYFPVVDQANKLLPYFITISNIKSTHPLHVIAGNERVLRARLADAAFFFAADKKQTLAARVELLKNIVFQNKLGTLYDKALRLAFLTDKIAEKLRGAIWFGEKININSDIQAAKKAGELAKTDLTTQLVGEFPELQGIAGYYYALHDGEASTIAIALKEQYLPRFAGDDLPASSLGCALAIADRLDTLVGMFGIQQRPTGDKDPLGLRRAALGVMRILIEKKLDLDLEHLLNHAVLSYKLKNFETAVIVKEIVNFMFERLKHWYQEQGITADVLAAVLEQEITKSRIYPYAIDCRIRAVQEFKKLSVAPALIAANKRVKNILAKNAQAIAGLKEESEVKDNLFELDVERDLNEKINQLRNRYEAEQFAKSIDGYTPLLKEFADLHELVNSFFDQVLVMAEDKARRENRLLLLKKLRDLFLSIADVALLQ
jgi:glycyl-tRNA synthetase beta chain